MYFRKYVCSFGTFLKPGFNYHAQIYILSPEGLNHLWLHFFSVWGATISIHQTNLTWCFIYNITFQFFTTYDHPAIY